MALIRAGVEHECVGWAEIDKYYGIPQNRERIFVVSVLNSERPFYFPKKQVLNTRIRHYLEDNVPESYYLNDKRVQGLLKSTEKQASSGNGFSFQPKTGDDIANSITSVAGGRKTDNFIAEPKIQIVGNTNKSGSMSGVVVGIDGISPCLCDAHGEVTKIAEPTMVQLPHGYVAQSESDICPTITQSAFTRNCICKEPVPIQVGALYDNNAQAGRIYSPDGIAPTIKTFTGGNSEPKIECGYRYRKLTERECFRLMGVSDDDIDKIQATGICKTQQYKLAGNSIVVDTLAAIFDKLFVHTDASSGEQLKLFIS